ncbi:MAG TPA: ABC transporter permease, partial [Vicinamibacterales bacterium]|nr:ABC transporter permease [Vicinamibacterales bacterium]
MARHLAAGVRGKADDHVTRQPGIRGPRAARWLVERLLPPEEAARLLDALDEELVEFQEHERGRRRARLWYWGQALRSARILRGRRLALGAARRGSAAGSRLADAFREVRLIVRALRRTPAFTVMAVATLALGIGTTTTLFSVIDQVVLRPLPYREPDRIIRAWTRTDDGDVEDFSFRVVEYQELARTGRFEAIGGEFPINVPVVLPGQPPFQVLGRMITPDFFDVFGTRPALGRMFRAGEVAAGDARVVVVTHRFWTRYLGASRSAVDD